jgi:hypothetical protein
LEALSGSDADHLLDEIQTRNILRHWMLYLLSREAKTRARLTNNSIETQERGKITWRRVFISRK